MTYPITQRMLSASSPLFTYTTKEIAVISDQILFKRINNSHLIPLRVNLSKTFFNSKSNLKSEVAERLLLKLSYYVGGTLYKENEIQERSVHFFRRATAVTT